jgi:hypothetical protein
MSADLRSSKLSTCPAYARTSWCLSRSLIISISCGAQPVSGESVSTQASPFRRQVRDQSKSQLQPTTKHTHSSTSHTQDAHIPISSTPSCLGCVPYEPAQPRHHQQICTPSKQRKRPRSSVYTVWHKSSHASLHLHAIANILILPRTKATHPTPPLPSPPLPSPFPPTIGWHGELVELHTTLIPTPPAQPPPLPGTYPGGGASMRLNSSSLNSSAPSKSLSLQEGEGEGVDDAPSSDSGGKPPRAPPPPPLPLPLPLPRPPPLPPPPAVPALPPALDTASRAPRDGVTGVPGFCTTGGGGVGGVGV